MEQTFVPRDAAGRGAGVCGVFTLRQPKWCSTPTSRGRPHPHEHHTIVPLYTRVPLSGVRWRDNVTALFPGSASFPNPDRMSESKRRFGGQPTCRSAPLRGDSCGLSADPRRLRTPKSMGLGRGAVGSTYAPHRSAQVGPLGPRPVRFLRDPDPPPQKKVHLLSRRMHRQPPSVGDETRHRQWLLLRGRFGRGARANFGCLGPSQ